MLILELFFCSGCVSAPPAIALAKKAVEEVPGVELVLRSDRTDQARAKALGIFISPTFVLGDKICLIGEPSLEQLIQQLRERL